MAENKWISLGLFHPYKMELYHPTSTVNDPPSTVTNRACNNSRRRKAKDSWARQVIQHRRLWTLDGNP